MYATDEQAWYKGKLWMVIGVIILAISLLACMYTLTWVLVNKQTPSLPNLAAGPGFFALGFGIIILNGLEMFKGLFLEKDEEEEELEEEPIGSSRGVTHLHRT